MCPGSSRALTDGGHAPEGSKAELMNAIARATSGLRIRDFPTNRRRRETGLEQGYPHRVQRLRRDHDDIQRSFSPQNGSTSVHIARNDLSDPAGSRYHRRSRSGSPRSPHCPRPLQRRPLQRASGQTVRHLPPHAAGSCRAQPRRRSDPRDRRERSEALPLPTPQAPDEVRLNAARRPAGRHEAGPS